MRIKLQQDLPVCASIRGHLLSLQAVEIFWPIWAKSCAINVLRVVSWRTFGPTRPPNTGGLIRAGGDGRAIRRAEGGRFVPGRTAETLLRPSLHSKPELFRPKWL